MKMLFAPVKIAQNWWNKKGAVGTLLKWQNTGLRRDRDMQCHQLLLALFDPMRLLRTSTLLLILIDST
jgi:hypothetical protein